MLEKENKRDETNYHVRAAVSQKQKCLGKEVRQVFRNKQTIYIH